MKMYLYVMTTLFLGLLAGCSGEEPHAEKAENLPAVAVATHTVATAEGHLHSEIVGTVQAVNQAVIAAKITGSIEEMPVVLGAKVKAGELLLKISAGEISAKVIQAQAQKEQARRNLERERKLLKKNAATSESVKSLEDISRVAEAAYREAQTMLSYATINAPFTGVVTFKAANVGDLATPGTPLLHLEDSTRLQVVTSVPETLVLQVHPGDLLAIKIPAADLNLEGTIAEIAPVADPLSRSATVKINIPEQPRLRSGQFARVAIPGENKESLFIPSSAVHTFGQIEQVFVIENGRAHLRLVRTGAVIDDRIEILTGLEPGEIIATDSSSMLIDSQPVTTVQ